jgi:hypothetical protein
MFTRAWVKSVGALLVGLACLGKSFAYLGVPSARLFIGDMFLGLSILSRPRAVLGRWFHGLVTPGPLNHYAWMLLLLMQYGVIEALRGFSKGHDQLVVLQELVFNIYPLYLFLGIEVGVRNPAFLRKLVRVLSWSTGVYGIAYILVLSRLDIFIPGTRIPVFGQTGGGFAIVALLCIERRLLPVCVPLCLNAFVMLGMQVRAEWLGFFVGLTIWGVSTGRWKRLLTTFFLITTLLGIGYMSDFSIPSPRGRGGVISTRAIIGRMISGIDPELAAQFSDQASSSAGTLSWRRNWWQAIWTSSHQDLETAAIGHAYGFPIADLVTYLAGEAIRTPHNDFFYALGYTGWIGVLIFYSFLLSIFRLVWWTFRRTRQPLGLVLMGASLAQSFFGNLFETPFGAIPTYLLAGMLVAPMFEVDARATIRVLPAELFGSEQKFVQALE